MPPQATTGSEFWRDLEPIDKVFQSDARPEVYLENAPTDDERFYVPLTETVSTRPLWISPAQNRWCDVLMAKEAGLVAHDHPEPMKVHFNVRGPLVWLDEDGEPDGFFDVFNYLEICREHYEQVGIGADYVEQLLR